MVFVRDAMTGKTLVFTLCICFSGSFLEGNSLTDKVTIKQTVGSNEAETLDLRKIAHHEI